MSSLPHVDPVNGHAPDLAGFAEPVTDSSDSTFSEVPATSAYELPPQETPKCASGFGSTNRFFAYSTKEAAFVVDALLRAQQIGSLTADRNLGKTPVLQQLTICVGAGLPFLDRATTKRPVIVLDGETPIWTIAATLKELLSGSR